MTSLNKFAKVQNDLAGDAPALFAAIAPHAEGDHLTG
jgi:hypothetical protein